jgi:hypothetical protein
MILTTTDLQNLVLQYFGQIVEQYDFEVEVFDLWKVAFFRPKFAIIVVGDREGFEDSHVERRKRGLSMTGLFKECDRRIGSKMDELNFGSWEPMHVHETQLKCFAYRWANYYQDILSGDRAWLNRYDKKVLSEPYRSMIPHLQRLEVVD